MATKTIADKLQIKPNTSFWISDPAHLALIGPLPTEAHLVDALASASVGLIFGASAAEVRASLDAQREQLTAPAILWVAYPKGNTADINRDSLWKIVADYGMRPNGQVALDDTWSALRFRANREGEEVFTGGRS
jgi:hypothetical protein